MKSMDLVEKLVKSNIPIEHHKDYFIKFVSYNRKVAVEEYTRNIKSVSRHEITEKEWNDLVYIHKYMSDMDEAGFINKVYNRFDDNKHLFIPIIDFAPNLNIDTVDFNKLLKSYKSNRLTIFNSGNSYHGVLDKLMTYEDYKKWIYELKEVDFVDQKWLDVAIQNVYGDNLQVLRTTWTKTRPEPVFLKEVRYDTLSSSLWDKAKEILK